MLLQNVALLLEDGILVGDGDSHAELVVGVILIHDAVVEQQGRIWLRAAPGIDRLAAFVGPVCLELDLPLHLIPCQHCLHVTHITE